MLEENMTSIAVYMRVTFITPYYYRSVFHENEEKNVRFLSMRLVVFVPLPFPDTRFVVTKTLQGKYIIFKNP